jgi:hypothetical protein
VKIVQIETDAFHLPQKFSRFIANPPRVWNRFENVVSSGIPLDNQNIETTMFDVRFHHSLCALTHECLCIAVAVENRWQLIIIFRMLKELHCFVVVESFKLCRVFAGIVCLKKT